MFPRFTTIATASFLLAACNAPTSPTSETSQGFATSSNSLGRQDSKQTSQENCTFSRGTTTCTSTVQYQETVTESVYSGCVAGPTGVPGRRVTTSSNTYTVIETTTTLRRGKSDKVYSSQTVRTRTLVSSIPLSTTCDPI
jgi:hypothetical protein